MHAAPFIPFIKPALDALKASLAAARKQLGKRKYERLLSATVQELLQQDPDISVAEAQLAAIHATGVQPDATLLRAERMLKSVRHDRARRSMATAARARWAARKRPARKKHTPSKRRKTPPRKPTARKRSGRSSRKA
jgi:hypothetical protein